MEGPDHAACQLGIAWAHAIIGLLGAVNAVLTTWLTVRARRRDKKETRATSR